MFDLDTLLTPRADDAPCGEDLEYDERFIALEMASRPGEERVIGDAVIPAEEPDYDQVLKLGPDILDQSMDLRVSVMLADAILNRRSLPDFTEVLAYMHRALADHWDHVHPQLDEDDGDPVMRVNAVLGLTNRETILTSLRAAALVESRAFGRFSLRDLQIASGEVTAPEGMENIPNMQTISAAFQDAEAEALAQTATSVADALAHVKAISAVFETHIGTEGPDLAPLEKMLFEVQKHLGPFVETGASAVAEDVAEDASAATTGAAPQGTAGVGAIQSPNDVTRALDQIMDYYARYEPSSPLPILLNRAKRLVSADFVTIMKDLAPQGVENVALIGGFPADDDY